VKKNCLQKNPIGNVALSKKWLPIPVILVSWKTNRSKWSWWAEKQTVRKSPDYN